MPEFPDLANAIFVPSQFRAVRRPRWLIKPAPEKMPLVAAVRVHHKHAAAVVAVHCVVESDPRPVRRPSRVAVVSVGARLGEPSLVGAVGVHHVNLTGRRIA